MKTMAQVEAQVLAVVQAHSDSRYSQEIVKEVVQKDPEITPTQANEAVLRLLAFRRLRRDADRKVEALAPSLCT